jgi:hypothetical protein
MPNTNVFVDEGGIVVPDTMPGTRWEPTTIDVISRMAIGRISTGKARRMLRDLGL